MKHAVRALGLALALSVAGSSPGGAAITPANVGSLVEKWDFPTVPNGNYAGVTSSPVVANGLVYVTSWNGFFYALDPATGAVRWSYGSNAGALAGIETTPLFLPDGRVCIGDSLVRVTCFDALDGTISWQKTIGRPGIDNIWSTLATARGRLFVSVASLADRPCTQGRLVVLDLEGNDLWTLRTTPDRICDTDTAITCTDNTPCGGGNCVEARGAGVTATVAFDPTGDFVYMNTVGCYTFPSIGDSDSMFKVDAATGRVVWKNRVDPPEQFGFCVNDSSVDCGTDAMCSAVGGTCRRKTFWHDFGFLNGPIPIDVPDGAGGTKTLIVSGSKNGTLYAFNEADGSIAWKNVVKPEPVSPGFAGFGLFNGAMAYADGRIHAALFQHIPRRVCDNNHARGCEDDSECDGGGTCLPEPPHLIAFDPTDGSILWSDDIGPSWGHSSVVNGVLYVGSSEDPKFYAYDAAAGDRLATFTLPLPTVSRATVDGNSLYVGYGILDNAGGVRAFTLCGNNVSDEGEECDDGNRTDGDGCDSNCTPTACGNGVKGPSEGCDDGNDGDGDGCDSNCTPTACGNGIRTAGEACDDGPGSAACDADCTPAACGDGVVNQAAGEACDGGVCCAATCGFATAGTGCGEDGDLCTDDACDGAGTCAHPNNAVPCDDGDACTAVDRCAAGTCVGTVTDVAGIGCRLDRLTAAPCGEEPIRGKLARFIRNKVKTTKELLAKAARAGEKGKDRKFGRLRGQAVQQLDALGAKVARAATSQGASRISQGCATTISGLVDVQKGLIGELTP